MSGTSFATPHVTGIVALKMALGEALEFDGGIVSVGNNDPQIVETPPEPDNSDISEIDIPDGFVLIDDMLIPEEDADLLALGTYTTSLWPNGDVPYQFAGNITADEQSKMLLAMEEWENIAGVDFFPRNGEIDYIFNSKKFAG